MMKSTRAIYEHGHLRLLDPVDLVEGQTVDVIINHEQWVIETILGDLHTSIPDTSQDIPPEADFFTQIEDGFRGQPPLSESMLNERDSGR